MEFSFKKGILLGVSIGFGLLIVRQLEGIIREFPSNLTYIKETTTELLTPKSHKDWDNCLRTNGEEEISDTDVFKDMYGEPGETRYEFCENKGYKPYTENDKRSLAEFRKKTTARVSEWYKNSTAIPITSNDTCEMYLRRYKLENDGTGYHYIRNGEIKTIMDDGVNKVIAWNFKHQDASGKNMKGNAKCYISRKNGGNVKVELVKQSAV